jgi:hypothetical protein
MVFARFCVLVFGKGRNCQRLRPFEKQFFTFANLAKTQIKQEGCANGMTTSTN